MSDKYVEKNFLYLLVLSTLCHLAVFLFIYLLPPQQTTQSSPEPTMVDLTELPELPELPPVPPEPEKVEPQPEVKGHSEKPQRVLRETAPKGKAEVERPVSAPAPPRASRPVPAPASPAAQTPEPAAKAPVARGEGILKPGGARLPDRSQLFPSASRLARLEDNYREKYRREVEEGDTQFLNTDDILFGSFMRRFVNGVYGVWHYPEAAAQRGIEGTTLIRITFNRSGEIVRVDLLESSGSNILDDEVMRTLKQLGPIGSFPKGYRGDYYRLFAFFHYGSGGGRLH